MAKRKRKTLGDDSYARVARQQADAVPGLAKKLSCEDALERLILANIDGSKATHEDRRQHGVAKALDRAFDAYVNICLRR